MGIFKMASGLLGAGVSAVLTPLGAASDLLDGDTNMSSTKDCLHGVAKWAGRTIEGTVKIISDPFDEDDWDDC